MLSRDALRYAAALPINDCGALAGRIYGYNRLPVTPRWRRLLSERDAHARYLGIASGGAAARALSRDWVAMPSFPQWLTWGDRMLRTRPLGSRTYKLYVSPAPECLRSDGFVTIVSALSTTRATQFKVGADAPGLLRADKLVAYFQDFEALGEASARVREQLAGMDPHGVPFTGGITEDGLLSWGVDPPGIDGFAWTKGESWRLWLARRLARGVIDARDCADPVYFATERLRLEGVDPETWVPEATIFRI